MLVPGWIGQGRILSGRTHLRLEQTYHGDIKVFATQLTISGCKVSIVSENRRKIACQLLYGIEIRLVLRLTRPNAKIWQRIHSNIINWLATFMIQFPVVIQ